MRNNACWRKIKDTVWDIKYFTIVGIIVGIACLFGLLVGALIILFIAVVTVIHCYKKSRPITKMPIFFPE